MYHACDHFFISLSMNSNATLISVNILYDNPNILLMCFSGFLCNHSLVFIICSSPIK
ncbi:hypothetical protein E2C01_015514 [Portunus trituberculatus]|uniref:Uncharacterized protein n=1 Tax=Portunus trituberculatus TaxID=210409 RepID=A0A5B7DMZ7_PORTR|nr:hypothetical protein [Portunus trituberculatus]